VSEPITTEELHGLRRLADNASRLPWRAFEGEECGEWIVEDAEGAPIGRVGRAGMAEYGVLGIDDARYATAAANLAPRLAAALEGYSDVVSILAQALQHARAHVPEDDGSGEFARDDVDRALAAQREFWLSIQPPPTEEEQRIAARMKELLDPGSPAPR
jgi:hypothetical protein